MLPRAYVVHRIRGRLRLRIRDRGDDPDFFEQVRTGLEALPEEVEVRVNPSTGSILLLHPTVSFEELEALLRANGVFELVEAPPPPGKALAPLLSGAHRLDRAISDLSAGRLDLRSLLFIAAVGLAIRQLLRGKVLGPALPLLWMALELAGRVAGSIERNRSGGDESS